MSFQNSTRRCLAGLSRTSLARAFTTYNPHLAYTPPYDVRQGEALLEPLTTSSPPIARRPSTENERKYQAAQRVSRMNADIRPNPRQSTQSVGNKFEDSNLISNLERMQTRKWKRGDVYSPRDLMPAEMKKWRDHGKPDRDVFDTLGINPLDEYKNYTLLSEYMTTMGRIKHPRDTGLRPVNQRKIAKAIRRAIGMGFFPSVHVHPEMLRRTSY